MPQSLQCPRCNGSVTVADQAAGQRVKCPHCSEAFLAPGIEASANDDDDWLSLDDLPADGPAKSSPSTKEPSTETPSTDTPSTGTPSVPGSPIAEVPIPADDVPQSIPPAADFPSDGLPAEAEGDLFLDVPAFDEGDEATPAPASSSHGFSPDEEALLSQFTDELDDFTSGVDKPPAPMGSSSTPVPGAAPTPPQTQATPPATPKPKPQAEPVQYAEEYKVTCNVCGTFVYAKAAQAGKKIKCPDCFSDITVPPPPKVKKKFQVKLDEVESFTFEPNPKADRRPDPFQKSADDLLAEASQEAPESSGPSGDDTPSVLEWVKGIFSPFKDLGVLVHLAGLVVLAAVPTAIILSIDSKILWLALFPGGFFLAVMTVCCGLAILQAVANEQPRVTDWPTLDPFAWLAQLFVVVAALMVAAVPMWVTCMVILGPSLLSVLVTMLSIYAFFPFILLSMLDMNSPFIPFSSEVARSVTKCEEAWGGFYFSSGVLFVGLFLVFASSSGMTPSSRAVFSIFCAVACSFVYFGMLGRLAYSIGQAVNAPPRKDDIDRTRPEDAN